MFIKPTSRILKYYDCYEVLTFLKNKNYEIPDTFIGFLHKISDQDSSLGFLSYVRLREQMYETSEWKSIQEIHKKVLTYIDIEFPEESGNILMYLSW